jgi:uncharacterized protein (DUF1778 family)
MATTPKSEARLNFRLPSELKQSIEAAAAISGQTVSDFAVSVLAQSAKDVVHEHDVTVLSQRDRKLVMALLDDIDLKPNKKLRSAAQFYKKQME